MELDAEFKNALLQFRDSVIAQQLLGSHESPFPKDWLNEKIDQSISPQQRLHLLIQELQGWVILKAQELDEFEGEDLIRLRGEAVGCMYAIRELRRYFSEA